MKHAISVDIGGTNTRVALVDENYNIIKKSAFKTDSHNPKANVLKIKEVISSLGEDIVGIGICCPGPLDLKNGIVLTPPNLPAWHNFKIVEVLKEHIDLPIILENDANLACLGEAVAGAGQGYQSVQYYTISTGIGGGFVIDNKIFQGSKGFAQEVANVILVPNGPKIGDLKEGSLESICSGTAITECANKHGLNVNHAGEVNDLALEGNYIAQKIMNDAKEYLGNAIATGYAFLDPDVIVLGGGVVINIDNYAKDVERHTKNKVYDSVKDNIIIKKSELGDDSGLIGSAALFFNK